MARSASIDPLAYRNFWCGEDSIIVKYDDSKTDKAGECLLEKNICTNPKCPFKYHLSREGSVEHVNVRLSLASARVQQQDRREHVREAEIRRNEEIRIFEF